MGGGGDAMRTVDRSALMDSGFEVVKECPGPPVMTRIQILILSRAVPRNDGEGVESVKGWKQAMFLLPAPRCGRGMRLSCLRSPVEPRGGGR